MNMALGRIRTDLALETKEKFEEDNVEIRGVIIEEDYNEEKDIRTTTVKIETENGAKAMGRPQGVYITLVFEKSCIFQHDDSLLYEKGHGLCQIDHTFRLGLLSLEHREVHAVIFRQKRCLYSMFILLFQIGLLPEEKIDLLEIPVFYVFL